MMSDDIHVKIILARGGGYLLRVNGIAIPPTNHHGTQWDRLSNRVRQPSQTAPWRYRQDDMVRCVVDSFAIKRKIAEIVVIW